MEFRAKSPREENVKIISNQVRLFNNTFTPVNSGFSKKKSNNNMLFGYRTVGGA